MTAPHCDIFFPTGINGMHLSFFKEKSGKIQQLLMIVSSCYAFIMIVTLKSILFFDEKGKGATEMLL